MQTDNGASQSNTTSRTTVVLHWLLAIAVLFLFISSWWMLALPLPSADFTYRELPFQLHKNIGLSLFMVIIAMIAIRLHARQKNRREASTMLRKLADFDHWVIYGLIVACCVSGYLSSSYSGWETSFWWLVEIPQWAAERDDLNILYSDIHQWSCWLLLAVLTMHIAAALHHAFKDDGMLDRMFHF